MSELNQPPKKAIDQEELCRHLLSNLKDMYWWLVPENFVVFDLETTGLTPRSDAILEIGAISINKTKFLETGEVGVFECFVRQDQSIPTESQRVNHITNDMVKDGESEYEALSKFFEFCNGKLMLSYNSPFDTKFLKWTSKRCKYPIEEEYLESVEDIYSLAKRYISSEFVADRRLGTIAQKIGVKANELHRALPDSVAAFYVYIFIKQLEFNDKNYDLLQSSKRIASLTGVNEKDFIKEVMLKLYQT